MAQYPLIDLNDAEAVRNFAYKGKKGIAEDEVKAAMKSTLEGRGYEVHVKWGKKSGSDILAILGGNRVVIEAKGEGAYFVRPKAEQNYNGPEHSAPPSSGSSNPSAQP